MAIVVEIDANRHKSRSPGTKTQTGKAKPSHSSFKSALTGQTVLLPADEVEAYRALVESLVDRHRPASSEEQVLVQSLANIEWQLSRIPSVEADLYGIGRANLAGLYSEHEDPEIRAALIEAETFLKYQREFREVNLQETRLLRLRQKARARLRQIAPDRNPL